MKLKDGYELVITHSRVYSDIMGKTTYKWFKVKNTKTGFEYSQYDPYPDRITKDYIDFIVEVIKRAEKDAMPN